MPLLPGVHDMRDAPHRAWRWLCCDPWAEVAGAYTDQALPPHGACLSWSVPRARNARHTLRGHWRATEGFAGDYTAQEKYDGIYVWWSGARLFTKAGRELRAPSRWVDLLPPFPVVAELYLGPNTRDLTTRMSGRRRETPASSTVDDLWSRARLIAFDVPGCKPDWTYDARWQTGRRPTSRSHRLLSRGQSPVVAPLTPDLLPLQLVRRHAVERLPDLFRCVVHAVPWAERAAMGLLGHGIPTVRRIATPAALRDFPGQTWCVAVGGDGEEGAAASWRAMDDPYDDALLPSAEAPRGGAGEGCMLWRGASPWTERGPHSRDTDAIIKYKPNMLLVATVLRPPYHSHQRRRVRRRPYDDDDQDNGVPPPDDPDDDPEGDEQLAGYHVRLTWFVPFLRNPVNFGAWVSPTLDEEALRTNFPVGRRTLVRFVAFGRFRPLHARAVGRTLTNAEARCVQEHMVRTRAPGAVNVPLEHVRNAVFWPSDALRAEFPCDFAWDPSVVCRASAEQQRLHRANPRVVGASAAAAATTGRRGAPTDRPAAPTVAELTIAVGRVWRDELVLPDLSSGYQRDFCRPLFGMVLARMAVGATPGTAATGLLLLREWGPFRVTPAAGAEAPANAETALLELHLCVALTVAAGVWQSVASLFLARANGAGGLRAPADLAAMYRRMVQRCLDTGALLQLRWSQPSVCDALWPPDVRTGLWPPMRRNEAQQRVLDLRAVLAYVTTAATGSGGGDAGGSPWVRFAVASVVPSRGRDNTGGRDNTVSLTAAGLRATIRGNDTWWSVYRSAVLESLRRNRWSPRPADVSIEDADGAWLPSPAGVVDAGPPHQQQPQQPQQPPPDTTSVRMAWALQRLHS